MKAGRKQFGQTDAERAIVQLIKLKGRVRRGGARASLSAIARDLNSAGHRTQTGRLWRAQTVKNVLAAGGGNSTGLSKKIKKTALGITDYLTKEQVVRLLCAARQRLNEDHVIIAVLVGSGLRASELCALQIRDLGIYDGKCQIDVRRGKGSRQRCIFISQYLSAFMRRFLFNKYGLYGRRRPQKEPVFINSQGEPLSYEALYKRVKRLGILADLPNLHPHTLRHTFGTLLYHYKKDLFFVKEQLGHSKVDTTQIYAKTLTESKLEQMDAFGSELFGLMKTESVPENTSKPESRT